MTQPPQISDAMCDAGVRAQQGLDAGDPVFGKERTDMRRILQAALRANQEDLMQPFALGARVTKKSGSNWTGLVVGYYSTELNPEGVCVESETEKGSAQIYPAKALKALANQESKP